MEAWCDDYLDRGQNTIIEKLEKDKKKLKDEQLKNLLEYEKTHDNRMKVISFLKKIVIKEKKDNVKKAVKAITKKPKKEEVKMGKNVYVIWTGQNAGITLPQKAGGFTVLKRRPLEVTQEALDYMKATYDKDSFREVSESEFKNFGKKKKKEAEE